MEARRRLPGAEAHSSRWPSQGSGQPAAVTGHHITIVCGRHHVNLHLEPLHGRIHKIEWCRPPPVLRPTRTRARLPGGSPNSRPRVSHARAPDIGTRNAPQTNRSRRGSRPWLESSITSAKSLPEMRQHEEVVQLASPSGMGSAQKGSRQNHAIKARTSNCCVRLMRAWGRHFEPSQLQQAQPPGGRIRRVQLVDAELGAVRIARDVHQNMAEDAIDQPGRNGPLAVTRNLAEGYLKLVEAVGASLVYSAAPGW